MINNKKKKVKREKKKIEYRTKKERQDEVTEILIQLTHFNLNMNYEPVKLLYKKLQEYIKGGDYKLEDIIGRDLVKEIKIIPFVEGYSSTNIINSCKSI